jgi:hypothetical protein
MPYTSDYLLYTKGERIVDRYDLRTDSFYQIDNKGQDNISPTDANVYCLENKTIEDTPAKIVSVYHFNPMKEYLFEKRFGLAYNDMLKVGDKPNVVHATKRITEKELENYNIYKVTAEYNRGSFLTGVPVVGSSINRGLNFIPGSSLLTNTLNLTKNVGTGAANALIGRGYGKRKRRTKKNKRKTRKTRKINRKSRK